MASHPRTLKSFPVISLADRTSLLNRHKLGETAKSVADFVPYLKEIKVVVNVACNILFHLRIVTLPVKAWYEKPSSLEKLFFGDRGANNTSVTASKQSSRC